MKDTFHFGLVHRNSIFGNHIPKVMHNRISKRTLGLFGIKLMLLKYLECST